MSPLDFLQTGAPPTSAWIARQPAAQFDRATQLIDGHFAAPGIDIAWTVSPDGHGEVVLAATDSVARLALRWEGSIPRDVLVLGDAFERSYGDLRWEPVRPERALHWYGLAHSPAAESTSGFGVRTGASAFCHWTLDAHGITLWLDVRAGDAPLTPRGRRIHLADVVVVHEEGAPWDTLNTLVSRLAPTSVRSSQPIVGANNWYYAYGRDFGEEAVLRDAAMIAEYTDGHAIRPFAVIDDGWNPGGEASGGPWDHGLPGVFDDLPALADRIGAEGARPGIWFRPLRSRVPIAGASRQVGEHDHVLDPSRDETLAAVAADIQRFSDWSFALIKHDFSTYDVTGGYGPGLGAALGGQPLGDSTRTTAEVIGAFYRTIDETARDLVVIGCNTVGHLAAGLVDVQRVGDDTSGRDWERTRRMGVNALAFRLPQHGRFFAADPDCIPATPATPWKQNRQFLDLVARSGTTLFVSIDPRSRSGQIDEDVREAVQRTLSNAQATRPRPIDWMNTPTPCVWDDNGEIVEYRWEYGHGPVPYPV